MKKILFLLLVSTMAIAQGSGPGIEIHVDPLVINATGTWNPTDMYAPQTGVNDPTLDAIIQNYGPCYLYNREYGNIGIYTENTNLTQFVSDLEGNPNVTYAHIMYGDIFTDRLQTTLVDSNVGASADLVNYTGVTNDAGLNQIFSDYNVIYYALYVPSLGGEFLRYYMLFCHCDNIQLKLALDNYPSVIEHTDFMAPAYLSAPNFEKKQYSITPNPFTTTFNIQTKENISNYAVFDLTGKQIISTVSKSTLDNQVQNLTAGVYVLQLQSQNGATFNQKLIKQ
jgi:hypothetical protein